MTVMKTLTANALEQDMDDVVWQQRLARQSEVLTALFKSWRDVEDDSLAEQRETLAILKKALNDNPLSDRPRFR